MTIKQTESFLKEKNKFKFSSVNEQKISKIILKYPKGRQASAVLPLLDLAMRQNEGYISNSVIEEVAHILEMPIIKVYEVATFYSMFNLKPVGKNLVQICTTTPCWLRGSDKVLGVCMKKLGIKVNETTKDNLFTLMEVECLGACVHAPMMQVNDHYYEDLNEERTVKILDALSKNIKISHGSQDANRIGSAPIKKHSDERG
tara:strand:+ start:224 stop:829 length:606 start_codon:yes stop_codon:yes gene_type:complete